MLGMNKYLGNRSREKGFTLVEMAIVLVIIGLIIAAVSIGKDAQRNAEYKKIINKYVFGWKEVYNQYYERAGVVLGDTADAASGKVGNGTAIYPVLPTSGTPSIVALGVKTPQGTSSATDGNATFRYWDHAGTPHDLAIGFEYIGTAAAATGGTLVGNLMKLNDCSAQIARMMDVAIDGEAMFSQGVFRCAADFTAATDETRTDDTATTCWWKMEQ